eukprot:COSAG01_NODE_6374_length_3705_cov_3.149473_4_plen_94_part_00
MDELLGETKVGDEEAGARRVKQQVLELEVTMADTAHVAVCHTGEQLVAVAARQWLLETQLVVEASCGKRSRGAFLSVQRGVLLSESATVRLTP